MKRHANSVSGPVTIIDVAREAGVSYATVSRVINNEVYVKAETRQRVTEALTKMGYVGNRQARSLRGGRSHTIGLLVPDLSTSYVGEIARGIGDELIKQQYDLMLYTTHWREQSEASHVATLTQGMVDGLLLVLPRSPQSYVEQIKAEPYKSKALTPVELKTVDGLGPQIIAKDGAAQMKIVIPPNQTYYKEVANILKNNLWPNGKVAARAISRIASVN